MYTFISCAPWQLSEGPNPIQSPVLFLCHAGAGAGAARTAPFALAASSQLRGRRRRCRLTPSPVTVSLLQEERGGPRLAVADTVRLSKTLTCFPPI